MLKKIITAVAVLTVLHVIVLGILSTVYPAKSSNLNVVDQEPDVEYFEFYTHGGVGGSFHHEAKVYQDATGYHLYYHLPERKRYDMIKKEYVDLPAYEKTLDLTKFEYLQCTSISRSNVQSIIEAEPPEITDALMTSVRIKFKGEDEIKIEDKRHGYPYWFEPMENILFMGELKKEHLENDKFVLLYNDLASYAMKQSSPFLRAESDLFYDSSNSIRELMSLSLGVPAGLWNNQDLQDYARKCRNAQNFKEGKDSPARDFIVNDSIIVDYAGNKAYLKAKVFGNVVFFHMTTPAINESVTVYSIVPGGADADEYLNDMIGIFNNYSNRCKLDRAVTIEVISFFAVTAATVLVICLTNRKKDQETI